MLPIGADVSAKFKGAFCEAKVKKINKSVRCKVGLKEAPFGSVVVDAELIKGPLELNAIVEVTQGKQIIKATIQHVMDHSTYTVVFNDGDERNLRRTQLCLKGGKHFDEAVNLDALPLYNPEQFGSPVHASGGGETSGSTRGPKGSGGQLKHKRQRKAAHRYRIGAEHLMSSDGDEDDEDDLDEVNNVQHRRPQRRVSRGALLAARHHQQQHAHLQSTTANPVAGEESSDSEPSPIIVQQPKQRGRPPRAMQLIIGDEQQQKRGGHSRRPPRRSMINAADCCSSEQETSGVDDNNETNVVIGKTVGRPKKKKMDNEESTKKKMDNEESTATAMNNRDEERDKDNRRAKTTTKDPPSSLFGRCVCVYEEPNRKGKWYPAVTSSAKAFKGSSKLIISKTDTVVRSFRDGKFAIVPTNCLAPLDLVDANKPCASQQIKQALDKAVLYLTKDELPSIWDRDTMFNSVIRQPSPSSLLPSTSSSTLQQRRREPSGDSTNVKIVKKPKPPIVTSSESASSSEEEEYGEERDVFVAQLYKFQEERGTPINRAPILGGKDIDLYRFYQVVQKLGGFKRVTNNNSWKRVLTKMKLDGCSGATPVTVKNAYLRYLSQFTLVYRRLGWCMDQMKSFGATDKRARVIRVAEKDRIKPKKTIAVEKLTEPKPVEETKEIAKEEMNESSSPVKDNKKEHVTAMKDDRGTMNTPSLISSVPVIKEKQKDKTDPHHHHVTRSNEKSDGDDASSVGQLGQVGQVGQVCQQPRFSRRRRDLSPLITRHRSASADRNLADEKSPIKDGFHLATANSRFFVGQKIRAQHDGRWYDARVEKVEESLENNGGIRCFVHYHGWNSRYDEWLTVAQLSISNKESSSSALLARVRRTSQSIADELSDASSTVATTVTNVHRSSRQRNESSDASSNSHRRMTPKRATIGTIGTIGTTVDSTMEMTVQSTSSSIVQPVRAMDEQQRKSQRRSPVHKKTTTRQQQQQQDEEDSDDVSSDEQQQQQQQQHLKHGFGRRRGKRMMQLMQTVPTVTERPSIAQGESRSSPSSATASPSPELTGGQLPDSPMKRTTLNKTKSTEGDDTGQATSDEKQRSLSPRKDTPTMGILRQKTEEELDEEEDGEGDLQSIERPTSLTLSSSDDKSEAIIEADIDTFEFKEHAQKPESRQLRSYTPRGPTAEDAMMEENLQGRDSGKDNRDGRPEVNIGDSDNASDADTPAYGDEDGPDTSFGASTPSSSTRGLSRKFSRGAKRKRYGRNYSDMVIARKHVKNNNPRKNDQEADSDGEDGTDPGCMSPKDSVTALRNRIQAKMEAENDWECDDLHLTPIDQSLTGDALINALMDQMQEVRELYQQAKTEYSWLDRRYRKTMEKRKVREKQRREQPMMGEKQLKTSTMGMEQDEEEEEDGKGGTMSL